MKTVSINITLAFFLLSTISLCAQKRSYDRIKAQKMAYIVDNSNLNAEEETTFWEIFGASEDSLYKTLYRKKKAIKKELKEYGASLTAQEIKTKIEMLDQMESDKAQIIKNRNQALMKELSPQKALQIIHAADEFSREMYRRGQRDQKNQERGPSN